MTYTIQHLSRATIEKAESTKKTEAEEVTCDILAVCNSLNKLCDVLSRLDYVINNNMETDIKDVCHHERKECLK